MRLAHPTGVVVGRRLRPFAFITLNSLWSGCFNRFFIAATTMAVPILQRRATGAVAALCVYFRSLPRRAIYATYLGLTQVLAF